jgi:citrate lyase beta subunit
VRHFSQLDERTITALFLRKPEDFDDATETLAVGLGATLYVPATRPDLAATVRRLASEGVRSLVLDLEDAVGDHEVDLALANVQSTLDDLGQTTPPDALVFVRVRSPGAIRAIAESDASVGALTGFVIPKFTQASGPSFLDAVAETSDRVDKALYAMPVLESPRLVHRETRNAELQALAALFRERREQVLAVRIGATDMCGAFGIRRDRDLTIYDVRVVADVIADIVNHLGRADGSGFVITGPVWEYYADRERMLRPLLRSTPFEEHDAVRFRRHLVSHDLDGLLREIALDRANGIQGKTVIHPSHVAPVHALSAVTHEEFHDALDIAGSIEGVRASGYRNKMNESKPHRFWADQTLLRARVFGVTNKGVTFVDLIAALTACTPTS